MNNTDAKKAAFFDCWGTVMAFHTKEDDWNTRPLKNHCLNSGHVDWAKVDQFGKDFLDQYYENNHAYEITAAAYLRLITKLFDIALDCPPEVCAKEIFSFLDPKPISGIERFLTYLDDHHIYYAILSNTIYTEEETKKILNQQFPGNHFGYFFASSDIGVKKPNPLFFQASIKDSGHAIQDSYYIGDSPIEDVYGSFKAGFKKSVWINSRQLSMEDYNKFFNPDEIGYLEADSYDGIIQAFEKGLL